MKRSLFVLGIVCLMAAASVQAADIYVESRTGGQNLDSYSETGTFANSTAKSTASGVTALIGCRYSETGIALGRIAHFKLPASASSQWYSVYITTPVSSSNSTNGQTSVHHNSGTATASLNLRSAENIWVKLGDFELTAGVSSVDLTFTLVETGKRISADSVKFTTLDIDTPTPTVPLPTVTPGIGDIYIESRPEGQNYSSYAEVNTWADNASKSTASGVTAGIGCRTFYTSAGAGRQAKFYLPTPQAPGRYEVSVTYPTGNTTNGRWWVNSTSGLAGGAPQSLDQTQNANTWISLGTYEMLPGQSFVQIGMLSGDEQAGNFLSDAAKFVGPLATVTPTFTPMPTPTLSSGMDERYMHYE